MLKCIGYRFKSYHNSINGTRIDSDKLIFSYISDEDPGVVGWESHQLEIKATSPQMLGERLSRIFGVSIMNDQVGNLIAPELDKYLKQPVFISCSFDQNNRATVNRVIIDPSQQVNDTESKGK
jgi:hypothetical protein